LIPQLDQSLKISAINTEIRWLAGFGFFVDRPKIPAVCSHGSTARFQLSLPEPLPRRSGKTGLVFRLDGECHSP
jgi:hypothetical protein